MFLLKIGAYLQNIIEAMAYGVSGSSCFLEGYPICNNLSKVCINQSFIY